MLLLLLQLELLLLGLSLGNSGMIKLACDSVRMNFSPLASDHYHDCNANRDPFANGTGRIIPSNPMKLHKQAFLYKRSKISDMSL
jgi:hypothetical protein